MTAWDAIQNAIELGDTFRVEHGALSELELDELEQVSSAIESDDGGVRYTGMTPDGDEWTLVVEEGK